MWKLSGREFIFLGRLLSSLGVSLWVAIAWMWWGCETNVWMGGQEGVVSPLPESFYGPCGAEFGGNFWELEQSRPTFEVPDLRNVLSYYGRSGRPDSFSGHSLHQMMLEGMERPEPVDLQGTVYLGYASGRYVFSQQPTRLAMDVEIVDHEAIVKITMRGDNGELLEGGEFRLGQKELTRQGGVRGWEIEGFRVDGTLLARMKGRWFGQDRLFEKYGGPSYAHTKGRERIDFGEGESLYSVFIGVGEGAIFRQGQWHVVPFGEESVGHPLLCVKKVDERLMTLELYDESGQRKMPLNLIRGTESWRPEQLMKEFRFLGARTRSTCVFEVGDQRMFLRPSDFLLWSDGVWEKIEGVEAFDAYVARKKVGTCFVFDGVERREEHQVMCATLISPSRANMETMEVVIHKGGGRVLEDEEFMEGEEL